MQCKDAAEFVSALVDGEVGDERHRAAATHVASCHICTALADDYRAIGRQLAGGYQLTPAHLADKIRARLAAEADTARDTRRPDWRRWARQAAVLVLACGLSAFMTWHLTQLSAQNAGRVDFAPAVKDLTAEGFALAGGRLDLVGDRRIAAVVYKRRQHVINVFMWPAAGLESPGPKLAVVKGYNALTWTSGGLTYWAVSDLNAAELGELQKQLG